MNLLEEVAAKRQYLYVMVETVNTMSMVELAQDFIQLMMREQLVFLVHIGQQILEMLRVLLQEEEHHLTLQD